jgi:SPP1 family predicted phage head-tail adaptor
MRAGKLDREIVIQTYSTAGVDAYGTPTEGWIELATVRAGVVQSGTEEFLRAYGENSEMAIFFRTRFLDGVTTKHRVEYNGSYFNIREVKEIGRRKVLELRCEAAV